MPQYKKYQKFNTGQGITSPDLTALTLTPQIANVYDWAYLTRCDPTKNAPWQETNFTTKLHRAKGGGMPFAHAAVPKRIFNNRGLIGQWIAAPNGTETEPTFLTYQLDEAEITATLATGDATNPRYDLICIKLSYEDSPTVSRDFKDGTTGVVSSQSMVIERRVKLDWQVVQGTPAASPTIPAIPANYAAWALIKVPATFNALISMNPALSNEWRDMSFPMGPIQKTYVHARSFNFLPADFTVAADGTITATAGSKTYFAHCDSHGQDSRMLYVYVHGSIPGGFTYGMKGADFNDSFGSPGTADQDFQSHTTITAHTGKMNMPWSYATPVSLFGASPYVAQTSTGAQQVKGVTFYWK